MANVINCFASSNLTLFSTSIKVLVTTTLLGQKSFSSWQPNQHRNLFLIAQMCLFTSDFLFILHSWNIYHNLWQFLNESNLYATCVNTLHQILKYILLGALSPGIKRWVVYICTLLLDLQIVNILLRDIYFNNKSRKFSDYEKKRVVDQWLGIKHRWRW